MQANTPEPPSEPTPSKDPAAVWWGDAQRPSNQAPPPVIMPAHVEEPWRWRWSPWIGIMYGPIPVGLIIGLPLLLAIRAL